ncbi:structural protein [Cellulophaga phage phi46:1]|uniref:structural protein n=1 Tax=Cellulophaga phage phi46:1 TaxID=1327974 RepID=UPI00035166AA|nr:structural protein [Cellulophaga phage phi46:1]AGO47831.1 structural protein [Cellulophaga phage phi46:1]
MNELLYLNGTLLDLPPNSVTRQIRVAALADITTRRSSYSNQIKLPKTVTNVKALEGLGIEGSGSTIPYKENRIDYYIDSLPLIIGGLMSVEKDDEKYFYIRITDGLSTLSGLLKGYTLKDLPLGDLNHFLSADQVTRSYAHDTGFIYGFADYGVGVYRAEFMSPSVYCHTLFKKMFNLINCDYVSNFLDNDSDFLSEVLTSNVGIVKNDSNPTITPAGSIYLGALSGFRVQAQPIYYEVRANFTQADITGFTGQSNKLTCITAGSYRFFVDVVGSSLYGSAGVTLLLNDNNVFSYTTEDDIDQVDDIFLELKVGDEIKLHVIGTHLSKYFTENEYRVSFNLQVDFSVQRITGGYLVDVAAGLEDLPLTDFLGDIMNRYGLFISSVDENKKAYEFKTIESVLSDKKGAVNFTDKLAGSPTKAYTPDIAQKNYFKFTWRDEATNYTRNGSIFVDNYNLAETKTVYTSPFEIPYIDTDFGRAAIPLFVENDSGVIEAAESPTKLLRVERKGGVVNVTYFDETPSNFSGNIPFLTLTNIDMNHYLDKGYKQYSRVLNSYKEIDVPLNLSPLDVFNLAFDKLYYFKQFGRYYYLNSVKYSVGKVATANMVEVPTF